MKIIGNGDKTFVVFVENETGIFTLPNDTSTKYDLLVDEDLEPIGFKFDTEKEVEDIVSNVNTAHSHGVDLDCYVGRKYAIEKWYCRISYVER